MVDRNYLRKLQTIREEAEKATKLFLSISELSAGDEFETDYIVDSLHKNLRNLNKIGERYQTDKSGSAAQDTDADKTSGEKHPPIHITYNTNTKGPSPPPVSTVQKNYAFWEGNSPDKCVPEKSDGYASDVAENMCGDAESEAASDVTVDYEASGRDNGYGDDGALGGVREYHLQTQAEKVTKLWVIFIDFLVMLTWVFHYSTVSRK